MAVEYLVIVRLRVLIPPGAGHSPSSFVCSLTFHHNKYQIVQNQVPLGGPPLLKQYVKANKIPNWAACDETGLNRL